MKQHNGATPAETCRCCGADATPDRTSTPEMAGGRIMLMKM